MGPTPRVDEGDEMSDSGGFCASCGAALGTEAGFCSRCGTPATPSSAPTSLPSSASDGPGGTARATAVAPAPSSDRVTDPDPGPYPSSNVAVAVVFTLFAPFVSLIVALVLLQDQQVAARRAQLKNWAIGSGLWLGAGVLIGIAVAASIAGMVGGSGGGDCQGGINRLVPPNYSSQDGHHWVAEYQCNNGGTLTRPAHASWLNN